MRKYAEVSGSMRKCAEVGGIRPEVSRGYAGKSRKVTLNLRSRKLPEVVLSYHGIPLQLKYHDFNTNEIGRLANRGGELYRQLLSGACALVRLCTLVFFYLRVRCASGWYFKNSEITRFVN